MAINLLLEVSVTVANEEQAKKVIESVQSGLAEIAIKDRVLFGGGPSIVEQKPQPKKAEPVTPPKKSKKDEKPLVAVEISTSAAPIEESARKERSHGILGRRTFSRKGSK